MYITSFIVKIFVVISGVECLLYLEDDWLLLSNITSVISDAMTVLRNQGENTPIAQVLLNDQSSRDCAEGKESCAKSEFKGVAGWAR